MTTFGSHRSKTVIILILLYIFTLCFRLPGIRNGDIQPDELLWRARVHKAISELNAGHFSRITKNVSHPGVTGVIVMGAGIGVARIINQAAGWDENSPHYIDTLTASRTADAAVSSLLIPIVFIACSGLLGVSTALFIAILLALDPTHIALSRIAHIDTLLTLFVTCALLLYFEAVRRGSLSLKMLTGVSLGLAIATKVPAVTIIPALIALKPCLRFFPMRNRMPIREALFTWGDFWMLVTSHLVFGLIYQRLWFHPSEYIWFFNVKSRIAEAVYATGVGLQGIPMVSIFIIGTSFFLGAYKLNLWKTNPAKMNQNFNLGMVLLFLSLIFAVLFFVPQVLENLILFWKRMGALSQIPHTSYGHQWIEPHEGYGELIGSHLPEITLLGFLFAIVILVRENFFNEVNVTRRSFLLFLLLGVICWILPLSMAKKQAFRYILPAMPLAYIIAGFGITELLRIVSLRLTRPMLRQAAAPILLFLILITHAIRIASWYPQYILFANEFSGGLKGFVSRGGHVPIVGQHEIVKAIHQEGVTGNTQVFVVGEPEVIEEVYRDDFGSEKVKPKFVRDLVAMEADFFVVPSGMLSQLVSELKVDSSWERSILTYSFKGVDLANVYLASPHSFEKPFVLDLTDTARNSGHVAHKFELGFREKVGRRDRFIFTNPSIHKRGFLSFGKRLRVSAGRYHFSLVVGDPPRFASQKPPTPPSPILKISIGKRCDQVVQPNEIPTGAMRAVEFSCSFDVEQKAEITYYWFGKMPVVIGPLTVKREG